MEQQTPQQRRFGSRRTATGRQPTVRPRAMILAACAAVLAVVLAVGFFSAPEARTTPSAAPSAATTAEASASPSASLDASAPAAPASSAVVGALDARIQAILDANSQYQIGVAVVDLSQDAGSADVHEYGVRQKFVAASTAKVLAAAAYYHLVETGAASLDDPLGNFTAGFQLREMIQQSDNDSWSLIMDAVGHEELTEYAASLGVSYVPETNTLTPAEMATIVSRLYSGTLLNAGDTAQLLSYMQHTNYETLIPAAVPEGITVFHKYGLLNGELHDAAILAQGNTAYALVIYTKGEGLSDDPERTEVIHQLTQAVAGALV
ncbi:serine hydrolase [Arthrobacter sp. ok362]|uniref:serine hydrolase n=1 Tax=Arthrobacter sp. ok362 TaxID=1761745 RepID=UPI00088D3C7D|nr:serine hydrolase [Arthrobacter sp. ok362]SDL61430.1 Beta-lactamase enzyme family protein [Arthrobacter sp. ok362]